MSWQYFGSPVGYIQQVVVRVAMSPLDMHLPLASEAVLKATLSTVFDVVEHVENFQLHNGYLVYNLLPTSMLVLPVVKSLDVS